MILGQVKRKELNTLITALGDLRCDVGFKVYYLTEMRITRTFLIEQVLLTANNLKICKTFGIPTDILLKQLTIL